MATLVGFFIWKNISEQTNCSSTKLYKETINASNNFSK